MDSPETSSALRVFGKYLIQGPINKGGMAEVFLARPSGQRRPMAIKLMLKSLVRKKKFVDMFIHEGKLAMQLNHDAIVKTFEIGRIQGRHFICMEYLLGVDVTHVLKRFRTGARWLPVPHALHIVLKCCEGLHYAHELTDSGGKLLNVVNRDVSPSNVRLTFDGDVKLLDFGIAKVASSLSSEIGVLKGKFRHMSPEQVRGLPLDRRSDVFAAGNLLYELLTKVPLFHAPTTFETSDKVLREEVPPPSTINPRVHGDLDRVVLKALEKKPADRFESAEAMAQALRQELQRYSFEKSELRDLLREHCHDEWQSQKLMLEDFFSREATERGAAQEDVNYGNLLDLEIEIGQEPPADSAGTIPRWLYLMLGITGLVLVIALILIIVGIK